MENYSFAELAELSVLNQSVIDDQFQYWITVTFALVVAGFVAGDRLSKNLRSALAGIYLLATTILMARARASARTIEDIQEYLVEAGASVFADPLVPIGPLRIILGFAGAGLAVYFLIRRTSIRSSDADAE